MITNYAQQHMFDAEGLSEQEMMRYVIHIMHEEFSYYPQISVEEFFSEDSDFV